MTPSRWENLMSDPPAPDLGAIRANLEVFLGQLVTWREMETGWIRALLAAYDAQATRLAAMEQVVQAWAEAITRLCAVQDRDLPEDLRDDAILEAAEQAYHATVIALGAGDARDTENDAQATRLAAVEQLLQEADITCSCCQSWVETLQAAIHAGAARAGGSVDHPGKEEHQEDDQEQG